jgi:hypothetical protein
MSASESESDSSVLKAISADNYKLTVQASDYFSKLNKLQHQYDCLLTEKEWLEIKIGKLKRNYKKAIAKLVTLCDDI